ncbi:hypothetical protein MPH_14141, partial [Macrophomina phaseolina MS6]
MTSSKPIIVLKTADNWDEWYFIIQSRAKKYDIFDYIDPSKPDKPAQPLEPTEPPEPTDNEPAHAWDRYKIRMRTYERKIKQYEKLRKEINDLSTVIEDS